MLKIEHIPLDKIIPYVNNPKKHPEEQIKKIASSILEFGFKVPIVVDKDYVIIAGHGRYEAAKRIGLKEVPVIVADDLSPAQVKAFRIADNKVAESEWELEALAAELAQLKEVDYDLELTGYDEDEISELIRELEVGEEEIDGEVEDELPEVDEEAEPFSKRGDIWILGRHRVMCGDSTNKDDVERLMDGKKADLVFTDPPYGMNKKIKNDDLAKVEREEFHKQWLRNAYDAVKGGVLVWYKPATIDEIIIPARNMGFGMIDYFHLYKPNDIAYPRHSWIRKSESMIFLANGEVRYKEVKPYAHDTYVWNHTNKDKSFYHPTVKPYEVCEDFLKRIDFNIVLDLFGGSGSTLIAAEKTGRTCYMMELDPHYVDVIVWRYIHSTGKKDINLIRDGEKIPFSEIESEFMTRFE